VEVAHCTRIDQTSLLRWIALAWNRLVGATSRFGQTVFLPCDSPKFHKDFFDSVVLISNTKRTTTEKRNERRL
jgi:hypothetical protein